MGTGEQTKKANEHNNQEPDNYFYALHFNFGHVLRSQFNKNIIQKLWKSKFLDDNVHRSYNHIVTLPLDNGSRPLSV